MQKLGKIIIFLLVAQSAMAQVEEVQYNPNSISPIPRYEHLYKRRVWREINLKEKQNKGFFARNGEITKLIIESAKNGQIPAVYQSDSLRLTFTKDEYLKKLESEGGEKLEAWDPTRTYYEGDPVSYNGKNYENTVTNGVSGVNPETAKNGEWIPTTRGKAVEYSANAVTRIVLMEDVIFDKRRSRLYYDIQALELQLFDEVSGSWKTFGWYKYKDLEKVFRANPEKAIWFNRQNTAENKNYADAFLLRFFHSTIMKIENPDDESISETYQANGRPYYESIWAREWEEMKLMEKEHNLWEF